ncbi:hypothetical protein FPQ18DRAFT_155657 [Pyronema domesticum]|nr:hypothetical protein FPQ18DRAFT_155657 [Pyronema domesticum]
MAGRTDRNEYTQSAAAATTTTSTFGSGTTAQSSLCSLSFAARAGSHPGLGTLHRTNTDPSSSASSTDGESRHPTSRYRDGITIRAVTPEPEPEFDHAFIEESVLHPTTTATTPPRTPSRFTRPVSEWKFQGGLTGHSPDPPSPDRRRAMNRQSISLPPFGDLSIGRAKSRSPTGHSPDDNRWYDERPSHNAVGPGPISIIRHNQYSNVGMFDGAGQGGIGFPSTHSITVHTPPATTRPSTGKNRHRLLRPSSSVNTLQSQSTRLFAYDPAPQPTSPTFVHEEYINLLLLMKKLRGKMSGYVEFRMGDSKVWHKGFCHIDPITGALLYQREEPSLGAADIVIPDLRGCHVEVKSMDSDGIIDIATHLRKITIKLRPLSTAQTEHWQAALSCWTPIRPAGAQNKMIKSQMPVLTNGKRRTRSNSDATILNRGDGTIIKVGKMLLWIGGSGYGVQRVSPERNPAPQGPLPLKSSGKTKQGGSTGGSSSGSHGGGGGHYHNSNSHAANSWQSISCTLQENGEFQLSRDSDSHILAVVQLSQLSRCAVQQLDPSILDQDFCIAIYPQYTPNPALQSKARPVYLGIDTRILFEVWFVLLRAFTMPEIYGPPSISPSSGLEDWGDLNFKSPDRSYSSSDRGYQTDSDRDKDKLKDSYRIQRSLFLRIIEAKILMPPNNNNGSGNSNISEAGLDCYAEVLLDGEARAKTMVRTKTHNPFWREDYEFPDLPTVLTDVSVVLKQRDPRWKQMTKVHAGYVPGILPGGNDVVIGKVEVKLDELCGDRGEGERWLPLTMPRSDGFDERVGELYLRAETEELIVLMSTEYTELSKLLHRFDSGLTLHLARVITDLRRLADSLLQIFQVSSTASEWLMALAENEIDETLTRHKSGLVEANILFRGNSLLTKALDTHMKRLGREYLEETLGEHLQRIAAEDTYCEVDPMRIDSAENIPRNWKVLLTHLRTIWQAIFTSAERCPLELRKILRHIRSCVEDRYGDLLRTVSYSSVCGFLFLRFFCPAILNPKLFGLLKDHPGVRAQRTLTLIAKSLQGLANMTTFGIKEPWMSPMNEFLSEHKAELKDFVDSVTSISPHLDKAIRSIPPSYATPITIHNRLSQASKEGFPSLPYLIDQPRAFAALVGMWEKFSPAVMERGGLPDPLLQFDQVCANIRGRMMDCIDKAEDAERPSSRESMEMKWQEVAEKATGVPAMDGVYERYQGRGMQRVGGEGLGTLGYTVNVSSNNKRSGGLGGILGFGGGKRRD